MSADDNVTVLVAALDRVAGDVRSLCGDVRKLADSQGATAAAVEGLRGAFNEFHHACEVRIAAIEEAAHKIDAKAEWLAKGIREHEQKHADANSGAIRSLLANRRDTIKLIVTSTASLLLGVCIPLLVRWLTARL